MTEGKKQLDFSAVLASSIHDMKNSLTMLLTSLDEAVATGRNKANPMADELTKLQYEAKRVNNNLVQLLSIYKLSSSQYAVNVTYRPVADFFEEVAIEFEGLLSHNGITLQIDCPADLYWYFDRDIVMGVINNIVNNTIRYTRECVRLKAAEEDGWLIISIEDDGEGFPEGIMNLADEIRSGVDFGSGSTGLGFYFSDMAAKIHTNGEREGRIALSNDSHLGGGRFSLWLP